MDTKIVRRLEEASFLLLGHLRIGQPVSTLSGGENIRVKLLKAIKSTAKIFGIDEPFKGLSNTEIYCVIQYLNRLRQKDKTVIVVDHSEAIEQYFEKHIELVCDNGILKDSNKFLTEFGDVFACYFAETSLAKFRLDFGLKNSPFAGHRCSSIIRTTVQSLVFAISTDLLE